LVDPNLAAALAADAGVRPGDRVVEIGAGLGSLTLALADAGAQHVLAIEFDRALVPALLEATVGRPSIEVLQADATKIDWRSLLGDDRRIACGNLPYNVGTSIVLDILERAPMVDPVVVMIQREVADRLAATPRNRDAYGPTSVRVAYRADVEIVRSVPPSVFWPRPDVRSSIVRLTRHPPPVAVDERQLWRVVDESFSQRRKSMRSAMRRLGAAPGDTATILAAAEVRPDARPEELDLDAFARLAAILPA
jgi:16S rRNA (adenine1518-N6/adenine1519-N6)-dimethyltransferase